MTIHAVMTFKGEDAQTIARSIQPDNLPDMSVLVEGDCLKVEISAERIGTLLSTADDILMNIKIAEETLKSSISTRGRNGG